MLADVKAKILAFLKETSPDWVQLLPDKWQIDTYAPELIDFLQANYTQAAELSLGGGQVFLMHRIPGR